MIFSLLFLQKEKKKNVKIANSLHLNNFLSKIDLLNILNISKVITCISNKLLLVCIEFFEILFCNMKYHNSNNPSC